MNSEEALRNARYALETFEKWRTDNFSIFNGENKHLAEQLYQSLQARHNKLQVKNVREEIENLPL